jgi:hypothetical protein
MSYAVEWVPLAQGYLAQIWTNAPDRAAVTAAANAIDAQLARNPFAQSESRSGRTRILFEFPLGILFEVDEDAQQVTVLLVWRTS